MYYHTKSYRMLVSTDVFWLRLHTPLKSEITEIHSSAFISCPWTQRSEKSGKSRFHATCPHSPVSPLLRREEGRWPSFSLQSSPDGHWNINPQRPMPVKLYVTVRFWSPLVCPITGPGAVTLKISRSHALSSVFVYLHVVFQVIAATHTVIVS